VEPRTQRDPLCASATGAASKRRCAAAMNCRMVAHRARGRSSRLALIRVGDRVVRPESGRGNYLIGLELNGPGAS
jgi:hypothetical protein